MRASLGLVQGPGCGEAPWRLRRPRPRSFDHIQAVEDAVSGVLAAGGGVEPSRACMEMAVSVGWQYCLGRILPWKKGHKQTAYEEPSKRENHLAGFRERRSHPECKMHSQK